MHGHWEGARLLHVEDDESATSALARALCGHGIGDIVSAASVADACHQIDEPQLIDLVLLDLLLPAGESGVEVLEHLRARRWCVPVIVISGAVASERDALLKSHALPVHRKPLRIEALIQTIVALSPQRFASAVEHAIEHIPLTRRLAEMFRRMARGSHGRTLACELRITDPTLQSMRAEFSTRCKLSPEELLMEMRAAYPWPLPDFVAQTRGDARSYG